MIKITPKAVLLLLTTFPLWMINAQDQAFFVAPEGQSIVSADLHIHTTFSDGSVWPNIRVEEALKEGLDLISITDHLEYQPHRKDLPNPDRNRSYSIAEGAANKSKLTVIRGAEITRSMPPGHINAVFIQDANKLLFPDDPTAGIKEANRQKGLFFGIIPIGKRIVKMELPSWIRCTSSSLKENFFTGSKWSTSTPFPRRPLRSH